MPNKVQSSNKQATWSISL